MIKNINDIDQTIAKHKYVKEIGDLVKKYDESLDLEYLDQETEFSQNGVSLDVIKKEKSDKIFEFKIKLLSEFDKLEKNISEKSKKIIISNFPKSIQEKIQANEEKYFDRIPGETSEQHVSRMKNQFKALLVDEYIKNPENNTSLKMIKSNQKLKNLVYGIAETKYINIMSQSQNEIKTMRENELLKLSDKIHDEYQLPMTEEEKEAKFERELRAEYENLEVELAQNNKEKTQEEQPSWTNFIFESAKSIIKQGKELIAGISKYFTSL
jgi:hypothetical protein